MSLTATIKSVDQSLDNLTKSLPYEMIEWLKQRFQHVIQNLLNLNFADIRIDFVIDTNTVISTLLRYAEGKESILFKLIGNQIFNFHAPANIQYEIAKFIRDPKKKVDKDKLIKGWMKLMKILKIGTHFTTNALAFANVIIGNRDPKDVPFVAMYIDLGASNIITYDKDFEYPLLRPLKINNVGQVVASVYRGLLSFFVMNDLAPSTLRFCGQIILELVKHLFGAVKQLLGLFSAITYNAIEEAVNLLSNFFPQIRDWIERGALDSALLIIALIVGGIIIIDKKIRNNLMRLTKLIIDSLRPVINKFLDWIEKSIGFIAEWTKSLLPHIIFILVSLFSNISTVISHVKIQASKT